MKNLKNNTLARTVKDDPKDHIHLEIGDSKQAEFFPQAKIMRWGNETNLSIRRKKEWKAPKLHTVSDPLKGVVVQYQDLDEEVHIYEKPDIAEDGGLEIELVLHKKPTTNRFDFSIETKGLDFFYQPDQRDDPNVRQPENVVGSYAVYHKTKGGMNDVAGMDYKTGKFCHIYRPKIIDAKGSEVWGELEIDEKKGMLIVTVPQKFLDEGVYPVVVDPTIGSTSAGATVGILSTHTILASFTDSQTGGLGGKVTEIQFYGSTEQASQNVSGAIYNTGATANHLTPTSGSISVSASTEWASIPFPGPLLTANTQYGAAIYFPASASPDRFIVYYDVVANTSDKIQENVSTGFPTFPNPVVWDGFSYDSNHNETRLSIYATYTAAPSNTAPTAVDDTATTNEDTAVDIAVLANDTVNDTGDTLSIQSFTQPTNGTVTDNGDGTLKYTPNTNYNGSDSFTYDVQDQSGASDTAQVSVTVSAVPDITPKSVSDTGSGTDGVGVQVEVDTTDTGSGSDTPQIETALSTSDTATGTDNLSLLSSLGVLDTGTSSEVISALASLGLDDTGAGSEAVKVLSEVAVSDTGTSDEAINVIARLAVSDSGVASEAVEVLAQILASDTGTGVEALLVIKNIYKAVSDSGAGVDTVLAQLTAKTVNLTDSGTASEALSLLSMISLYDVGAGVDNVLLQTLLSLTDTATGTETLAVLSDIAVADSGQASDALSVLAQVALADSGVAIDNETVQALVGVGDTELAQEALEVLTSLAVSDSGLADEALEVLATVLVEDTGMGMDTVEQKLPEATIVRKGQTILVTHQGKTYLGTKEKSRQLRTKKRNRFL